LNSMKTIDMAQILSTDLKSRMQAQDLKLYMENSEGIAFALDFCHVKFATRCFMDEFYNLFLKDSKANGFSVEITNVPEDIKALLDAVSRTQVKTTVVPSSTPEVTFKTVKEFMSFLGSAAF